MDPSAHSSFLSSQAVVSKAPGPALVGQLLDRGADIESRDYEGNMPLHLAVNSIIEDGAMDVLELAELMGGGDIRDNERPCSGVAFGPGR